MRTKLFIAVLLGCLVIGGATAAFAQVTPEVRPFAGAFVPTGKQRDVLKDTWMIGAQGGVEMAERLHAIATLAWAANPGGNDPSVFDYNAGLEAFQPIDMSANWQVRPFAGLGLGARTYVGHGDNTGSETQFAGYGALGTEFQIRRIALRIEGRDYVSRFKGLNGTDRARTGNDLTFSGGVAFHW